ncbi:MAG: calcium/proton exchanger [Ktedonobacteraceae bacterium]
MPRWFYYLLLMAIVAPVISLIWGEQQEMAIFISSAISLIPLAALIGQATEDLEFYVGPVAGGLLNATFGNAPELIIGIFALRAGLINVVRASITGSIISNVLLVLGTSLAVGGWRWGKQYFSPHDAGQYSAMMILAVASLIIPLTSTLIITDPQHIQSISVAVAVIILAVYVMYLAAHVFHLRSKRRNPALSRKHSSPPPPSPEPDDEAEEVEAVTGNPDPREVEPQATPPKAWLIMLMLLGATIGTAWNSELLVNAIKPVTVQLGWSQIFIGLVIIPIIGNAAEHMSAIFVAYRDRIDLSMAIAAGSSIQVATFVAPLLVLISLLLPMHLTMVFPPLELTILGVAAVLFAFISLDGESSWFPGVQLVTIYVISCIVFFFIPA